MGDVLCRQELVASIARDAFLASTQEDAIGEAGRQLSDFLNGRVAFVAESAEEGLAVRAVHDPSLPAADAALIVVVAHVLDAAVRRAQRDTRLNRTARMHATARLAQTVAHDFNGLLGAIANLAELAMAELPSEAQASADLRQIVAGARQGRTITRRLESLVPGEPVALDPVAVSDVIADLPATLEPLVRPNVRIETAAEDALPEMLFQRAELDEILVQLLHNAQDAMPLGGRVVVEARLADLDGQSAIRISMSDDGLGMSSEVSDRATDPYYTGKPVGRGEGLGLARVYALVTRAGGALDIEALRTGGTAVHVYLPTVASRSPGAAAYAGAE
jgi:C4-dicarboxylate-specific signal transduction histidine kinase